VVISRVSDVERAKGIGSDGDSGEEREGVAGWRHLNLTNLNWIVFSSLQFAPSRSLRHHWILTPTGRDITASLFLQSSPVLFSPTTWQWKLITTLYLFRRCYYIPTGSLYNYHTWWRWTCRLWTIQRHIYIYIYRSRRLNKQKAPFWYSMKIDATDVQGYEWRCHVLSQIKVEPKQNAWSVIYFLWSRNHHGTKVVFFSQ
jgi:hypothetical protein